MFQPRRPPTWISLPGKTVNNYCIHSSDQLIILQYVNKRVMRLKNLSEIAAL